MKLLTAFNTVNPNDLFSEKERNILWILFGGLFIYLVLRGIYLPLMHDEIATFYFYIQSGVIFPPEAHYDANNHFLNSLLSHWSYNLFGSSPLAIRLPNVLAFILFFFSIKNIASRVEAIWYRWGFVLSVSMSYFIFEYFSETRGYGLFLAFLMAAIYQYIRLVETKKAHHVLIAGILLWLGTCANLTGLVSSIILFALMGLVSILHDWKANKKRLSLKLGMLVITGLPFLILVKWSFKLKELGLLYYGSLDGFYEVTIKSLCEVYVGSYAQWMAVLITLLFLACFIYLVIDLIQKKSLTDWLKGENILPILLVGSVIAINALAHIMEINFPEDRAGLYLFIYLSGGIAFAFSKWVKKSKWFNLGVIVYLYFPLSFLFTASLRQASFWVDARNSQPIFDMVKEEPSDFKFPLVVGGYATQELCWYYMSHQEGGNMGRLHWTNHPGIDANIELISPTRMENPLVHTYYDSIYYDKAADLTYFKRKKPLEKKLITTQPIQDVLNTKQEYYTLFSIPADSLFNKTLYVGAEMTLDAKAAPFRSRLVAAVDRTEVPTNLAYEFIQLDWLRKSWNGETNNLLQGTMIHDVVPEAEMITLYLWNPDTTEFSITNGTAYLYEFVRDW